MAIAKPLSELSTCRDRKRVQQEVTLSEQARQLIEHTMQAMNGSSKSDLIEALIRTHLHRRGWRKSHAYSN